MSNRGHTSPSVIERLDRACDSFVGKFAPEREADPALRAVLAAANSQHLRLGMTAISIVYRTPEQQQEFAATADQFTLDLYGNPSAQIRTVTPSFQSAVYNFDRISGLVIVNNFSDFPDHEVRPLHGSDRKRLAASIAGDGMHSDIMNRVLTRRGMRRLAVDIERTVAKA